jgi:hypothetical protein
MILKEKMRAISSRISKSEKLNWFHAEELFLAIFLLRAGVDFKKPFRPKFLSIPSL